MSALDGREQGPIAGTQRLVAAAAFADVVNRPGGFRLPVGVAGVKAPEVREQRDKTSMTLIDAVLYPMRAIDLGPCEDFAKRALLCLLPSGH